MDLLCTEKVILNDFDYDVLLSNPSDQQHDSQSHNDNTVTTSYSATVTTTAIGSTNHNQFISSRLISLAQVNTAVVDPTFLADRCLENLLKSEERHTTACSYFSSVQQEITPPMRRIVTEWMIDVCCEEKCQEEVVLLAINYMDRFLATTSILKTQLQILAAACLLLSSKLREPSCRGLSAELLVFYTDNSICKDDLIHWELYVLSRLKWDLSTVTPLDFLELLLIRLPIRNKKCPDLSIDTVRKHAQAFVSLAAKEHYFSMYTASTIASSSIAAALSGLNWHLRTGRELPDLLNRLTDLTGVEQDYLHECMVKLEKLFEEQTNYLKGHPHSTPAPSNKTSHSNNNSNTNNNLINPHLVQTCKMQANNQKDVQDIKF